MGINPIEPEGTAQNLQLIDKYWMDELVSRDYSHMVVIFLRF